ncbi:MAG: PEP-CTERM sorting domain-containing protein [Verrucomicrobiaceae bacterium]|nr:MAG: PEP-CTERM sorting domain-containing protein [Verrucomicrobiaceae bacterium]
MKKSLSLPLSRRLDTHFLTCSAIVAGVSTFTATKADAAILYSGMVNAPIQPASVNGGMYFDFELPGTITQGSRFDTWDVNPYESGTKFYINSNTSMVATGTSAANLLAGTAIGPDSIYNAVSDRVLTVTPPESGSLYLGFKFTSNNPGGSPTVMYGWAELELTAGAPGNLVSFAYENNGEPIAAGAIPEPSSLGLLALGSLGLSQLRRRRAA